MYRSYLVMGAFFGALAVILGAYGAHGLQDAVTDEKLIHGFQTGVQYQMYHSLALLAVGIIYEKIPGRFVKWAGNLFIAGIILFSGSLYLLTLLGNMQSSAVKIVGPVTPVGGLLLIVGWLFLLVGVFKKK